MEKTSIDLEKYIGTPYKHNGYSFNGVDCYGLVYIYYENELDINLSKHKLNQSWYKGEEDYIRKNSNTEGFILIDEEPFDRSLWQKHDALLFSTPRSNNPNHVGIWFPSQNSFLHSYQNQQVKLENLDLRFNKYLIGVYRHSELQ